MQAYNKAIVAVLMAIIAVANTFFNTGLVVDPATVNTVAALLTPILVWAIPNRSA